MGKSAAMTSSGFLAALPTAAGGHQLLELCLGSGVIGQHRVGLPAATTLSLVVDAGWVAMALDQRGWDRALALDAGTAIAARVLHYTLFPWRIGFGVPVLEEAEGQRGRALMAHQVLLYVWGLSGMARSGERSAPQRLRAAGRLSPRARRGPLCRGLGRDGPCPQRGGAEIRLGTGMVCGYGALERTRRCPPCLWCCP